MGIIIFTFSYCAIEEWHVPRTLLSQTRNLDMSTEEKTKWFVSVSGVTNLDQLQQWMYSNSFSSRVAQHYHSSSEPKKCWYITCFPFQRRGSHLCGTQKQQHTFLLLLTISLNAVMRRNKVKGLAQNETPRRLPQPSSSMGSVSSQDFFVCLQ